MLKIKNKSGLALGAIFALVGSLFTVAPAQAAAVETAAVLTPTGSDAVSANSMLVTEDFELRLRYGSSVIGATADGSSGSGTISNARVHFLVNSTSPTLVVSQSAAAGGTYATVAGGITTDQDGDASTNDGHFAPASTSQFIKIGLDQEAITSISAAVSVTLTPYLEKDGETGMTNGDAIGESYTVHFVPWSALGAAVTLTQPIADDRGATASVTVTAGTIRWGQLDGTFTTRYTHTGSVGSTNSASVSGNAGVDSTTYARTGANMKSVGFSYSTAVQTAVYTTSATSAQSLSAQVFYVPSETVTATSDPTGANAITAVSKLAVTARTVNAVSMSVVVGDNAINTAAGADARINSAFVVRAFGWSASNTTSVAVARTVTVSAISGTMEFDADSGVILDGTTYTSSAGFLAASLNLAGSDDTFTVSTFGQDSTANDGFTLTVESQVESYALAILLKAPSYTPEYGPTATAGLTGQTKSFTIAVADQWDVAPVRTDLRVKAVMDLDSSESEAVGTLTAGTAIVTLAPKPAARTGSGTVTFTVQKFNQDTQKWDDTSGTDSADWNVYSYADGSDGFTDRTATASASISYGVAAYSWSGVITVEIENSFSDISVAAPGLVIENNDQTTVTASDALTVAASGLSNGFRFASKIAGTYTVTFTNGTATTTSVITIDAAGHDKGASISFDKSSIASGETSTITGTLVDANGNPVATGGTASIAVTYTGKGLPYGNSTTMQTDADGEFTFQVLVLGTEKGDAAISATYKPTGSASSTRNVTSVHALTVGVAETAAADQKITVGTFKGYVAIYTKGYMGQRLSAKVAGKWLVVDPIAAYKSNDYSRTVRLTGAGYTITVDLYIDGVFVRSEVVTTK
jgi:hypothetical protein